MSNDLVERLRSGELCINDGKCRSMTVEAGCLCAEAADALEAKDAEIERLQEAVQFARAALDQIIRIASEAK